MTFHCGNGLVVLHTLEGTLSMTAVTHFLFHYHEYFQYVKITKVFWSS